MKSTVAALITALSLAAWLAAYAQETVGEKWAVVIGADRDRGKFVPARKFAVADAEAFYTLLTTTAGFKKDNVMLLTDRSQRKPTLRNIKFALGTFLGRSAQRDDLVIIYLAGQGAPEVDSRGVERDGLAKYFLPSDVDAGDLYNTALPLRELQPIFDRIQAQRVILFLDSSYSGAAAGLTLASKKPPGGTADDNFFERLSRSRGRVIFTSSRPSEIALEAPDLGHGIFTYYLVEGLQGAADLNRDGIVSVQELYEYVEQQVTRKSRAIGGNQHPMMKGELESTLPLVRVPRP